MLTVSCMLVHSALKQVGVCKRDSVSGLVGVRRGCVCVGEWLCAHHVRTRVRVCVVCALRKA